MDKTTPNGMIIKSINVEAAPQQTTAEPATAPMAEVPRYAPPPVSPQLPGSSRNEAADRYADRYGPKGAFPPPVTPPPVTYAQPAAPKGLQVLLNEKQLRVTLLVMVVKLLPPVKK